jgi:hypothetical protein
LLMSGCDKSNVASSAWWCKQLQADANLALAWYEKLIASVSEDVEGTDTTC